MVQEPGYGNDSYSEQARNLIRKSIKNETADIYFVSGGTQANLLVISSVLKSFESVISANTGHINVHEAGAIEATGHKVEGVITADGKLTSEHVQSVMNLFEDHHMVRPKMVYISHTTELGTLYTKTELAALSKTCKENNLYLFLDGARLGSALAAERADITLADIAELTDAFYIGGTKNGALLGEAIVLVNNELKKDFLFHIKQRGALLAKGRLVGVQFLELFTNDLFIDLARHANVMAAKLTDAFQVKDYKFLTESKTNQIFPILPNTDIEKLAKDFDFYVWKKIDGENSAIRLVTS
jgi:threonine aldolase